MTLARAARVVTASAPLLLAVLVAKLWWTGTLRYYVNDRTVWIVLGGALLFAGVGMAGIRSALRPVHEDGLSWRSAVFLVPVLIGLAVPARPLSAASGQASSLGALQLTAHISAGDQGDRFGYWISGLADHPDPSWWSGQHVTLVGFTARQAGLPPHSFIVARYLVTCCVVDATLLGFPVQLRRGAVPPEGAWIRVRGVFGREYWTDPSGSHYPLIQMATIWPAKIPASPYLSP